MNKLRIRHNYLRCVYVYNAPYITATTTNLESKFAHGRPGVGYPFETVVLSAAERDAGFALQRPLLHLHLTRHPWAFCRQIRGGWLKITAKQNGRVLQSGWVSQNGWV